jgi:radical SAM superfamily enzyme YgiQ (UPF0313 family)
MCREAGISTHYSNIVGFPSDTRAGIKDHVEQLREIRPDFASFYLLTPIPGTDQYDDFIDAGWINETNLDRFDGQCVTWQHPNLDRRSLEELLFNAYLDFYTGRQILKNMAGSLRSWRPWPLCIGFGLPVVSWISAKRELHPMSGGIGKVRVDKADQYIPLRKQLFGFDYTPLPSSLPLPESKTRPRTGVANT